MPAVIDTGGPRVLHCVERVERPVPRAQPIILSSPRPTHRNCNVRKQQPRFIVDGAVRCTENVALELFGSCIDEREKNIPENNERREVFAVDGRSSTTLPTTSSIDDLGAFVVRKERRPRFRDRKYYDAFQRRQINRRKRLGHENNSRGHSATHISSNRENVCPEINGNVLQNETSSTTSLINENLRQRTSTIFVESENHGFPTTSACHLTPSSQCNRQPEDVEQSSVIVMRLFGGCDLERRRKTSYRNMKKSEAANSSQGVLKCSKYEWQRECKCLSSIPNGLVSMKTESESERSTRERRKRPHKPRINQHKEPSYIQLVFILFLVAFGNGNFFKSSFGVFGGKSASVGARLGVLTIGTIVGTVSAVPVDLDAGARAERSANLSHISGASRKIQMYMKNRHLQILRDGTVNGTTNSTSEYTILQRTSVSKGQLMIQGVATCLYLCMDSCGLLYGSSEYTEECVFNETLEEHNYNTYSSVHWSTPKKTLYVSLDRRGQPRRVQAKGHHLGRLSAYASVLTQVVPPDRVEALEARMLGAQHNVRHHHNSHHHRNKQHPQQAICPTWPAQEQDGRDKFRCRKRKKRKQWKKRGAKDEKSSPQCGNVESRGRATNGTALKSQNPGDLNPPQSKRSCEGEASEELCRKQALDAPAKKRKSRIVLTKVAAVGGNKQQLKKKKELRLKKADERSSLDGEANEDVNDGKTAKVRVNKPSSNKRRRQGVAWKCQSPSPSTSKKMTERPTKTTVANSTVLAVTLPSSWYPGVSATLSTERAHWQGGTKSPSYSAKNSVTGSTSKDNWLEEDRQTFRTGKSHVADARLISTESPERHEPIIDESMEDHPEMSSIPNDWSSMETSDEAKSDESSMQENETTIALGENSTLMTTMDTTPPQRTEDYTRATTQSIVSTISANRGPDHTNANENSTWLATSKTMNRRDKSSYERFAM